MSSHTKNSTRGCAETHVDLGIVAKDLTKHNQALRSAVTTSTDLKDIVARSSDVAKQLLSIIEQIRLPRNKNRRWGAFKQALKTV